MIVIDTGERAEVLDSWCDCGDWWLGAALADGRLVSVRADQCRLVPLEDLPS